MINVLTSAALHPLCSQPALQCSSTAWSVLSCRPFYSAPVQPVRLSATGPFTGRASSAVCQCILAYVCLCPPIGSCGLNLKKTGPALQQTASYFFHWHFDNFLSSLHLCCVFGDFEWSRSNFEEGGRRKGWRTPLKSVLVNDSFVVDLKSEVDQLRSFIVQLRRILHSGFKGKPNGAKYCQVRSLNAFLFPLSIMFRLPLMNPQSHFGDNH